jgi:hypothetical protein
MKEVDQKYLFVDNFSVHSWELFMSKFESLKYVWKIYKKKLFFICLQVSRFCQQAVQIVQRVSFPVYPSLAVQMEPSAATEEENIGFGFETEKAGVEEEEPEKSDEESEGVELAVSDEEPEAATGDKSQPSVEDENDKSDSDLEVLEEIVVSAEVDIASAEEDEENESEVTSSVETERIDDDVELLDEQPAKKARQEEVQEVSEPNEEVESMLADFVG